MKPIRFTWTFLVFPALVINYLGQGALLLATPKAIENPFYLLFPSWALYPMVVLATVATVIASQAVISGTYSMTRQAIQLGFLPRLRIVYTSAQEFGQIYIPFVNQALLVAVLAAVLGFGSSARLGAAYGVAVTGTMLITTVLTFFVVRSGWHYNLLLASAATVFFFLIDATFFSANLLKIVDGGWFPLAIGIGLFMVMASWRKGRALLLERNRESTIPWATSCSRCFSSRSTACRAPRCSSRATRRPCRAPSCTTSRTTRCCTSGCCSSPPGSPRCRAFRSPNRRC